jgi:hypothetical protein
MTDVDPNGYEQHEPGAKLDAGKPDASLLLMFGQALIAVSEVGTHGAAKYTRGGWQSVPDGYNRYTAALLRHVFEENSNLYDDGEGGSGLLHAAHAAWNALARLELELRVLREDNPGKRERDEAAALIELEAILKGRFGSYPYPEGQ